MRVNAIRDVAVAVRGRRKDLGLSQAELARRVVVSRKWIYEFEAGKPTAEFGIVIRVLDELGLNLDIAKSSGATESQRSAVAPPVDLDALLTHSQTRQPIPMSQGLAVPYRGPPRRTTGPTHSV